MLPLPLRTSPSQCTLALRVTSAMVRILSSAWSRIGLYRAEERRRARKAHPIVCPAPELERSEQRISERNGYEPGVPCWVDHSSPDPASAASFYGELFGWESEDQMPPGGPGQYFSAQLRGKRVAAMGSQQNPEAPPMWNTYVAVESADDAVARVREAGGTAYGEAFDVFTAGRMAVLADPAGAPFCIWQAGEHHGAQLVNEPGALCWNELTTRDADGSKPFYASVFGWRTTAMDMGELEYTLWHAPGAGEPSGEEVIGGMMPMVGEAWPADLPPHWMVYFAVEDTDATASRCEELGGRVPQPPFDTPQGRAAVLADPQGAVFSVIALTFA